MKYTPTLARLIDSLRCLPGVGPKSAQRMAFYLLERDRDGGNDDRRHSAEQQRGAGDRRQDQAREKRVRERLGRVGEAVEDDPATERAAGDAEQDDLGQGALHERFLQGLEHQWW